MLLVGQRGLAQCRFYVLPTHFRSRSSLPFQASILWIILHSVHVGAETDGPLAARTEWLEVGAGLQISSSSPLRPTFPKAATKGRWRGELGWEPTDGHVRHVSMERTLEITLRALSGTLLLLLKHFKVNHVYQFEHLAMSISGFRGIPLILKFLNRKIETFLTALNEWVGIGDGNRDWEELFYFSPLTHSFPLYFHFTSRRIEGQHAMAALWPLHQSVPLQDNVMLGSMATTVAVAGGGPGAATTTDVDVGTLSTAEEAEEQVAAEEGEQQAEDGAVGSVRLPRSSGSSGQDTLAEELSDSDSREVVVTAAGAPPLSPSVTNPVLHDGGSQLIIAGTSGAVAGGSSGGLLLGPRSASVIEPSLLCARNLFSTIAFLRILQKLIKRKSIRQMAVFVESGAVILKRMLRVEHPLLNLYALKIIKGMSVFSGRAWRKAHMRLMSRCGRNGNVETEGGGLGDKLPQFTIFSSSTGLTWWCARESWIRGFTRIEGMIRYV